MTGTVDLTDLDMWARGVPYDEFARLRRDVPVAWHDEAPPNSGFWSVHCYKDIITASRDVATFSSARGISFEEPTDADMAARRTIIDTRLHGAADTPPPAAGRTQPGGLFLNGRSCIVAGMPRPREFEPDEVLDSAMRQFWERGYRATSVDDLVRATGVKPGSLYSAFPGGKHALLMGSLQRYSRLVVPQKLGDLESPDASLAQVRAYFDGLVQDLLSPEGRQGCLLVNSAIESAAADDEVAAVVRGHHARLEHCFTAALRNAVRRGEVPGSVDPVARAKGLVATSQGLMVVGKANPAEEVLRAIVDSAFAGLG